MVAGGTLRFEEKRSLAGVNVNHVLIVNSIVTGYLDGYDAGIDLKTVFGLSHDVDGFFHFRLIRGFDDNFRLVIKGISNNV
jgi:hypothetical protein